MYSGSFGTTSSTGLGAKGNFLSVQYPASAKKKSMPLHDLLFMFGVLGSLYTLVLTEKFFF